MIKYRPLISGGYLCTETYRYFSERYGKWITVEAGTYSDGATWAIDIVSSSWFVHDEACKRGTWDDGTSISAWQAAHLLKDILIDEAGSIWFSDKPWLAAWRITQAHYWFWATFLFGCKKAKENGWFHV